VLDYGLEIAIETFLAQYDADLIDFRRTLHAHPELAYCEHRTTQSVAARLEAAGLNPVILPKGTGLIADIGDSDGPTVALRADIDALPIADAKDVPYKSQVPNVCHACGHDVHTTVLLGAGMLLAGLLADGLLKGRVRLIFQPAEELSGGALDVIAAGGLDSVDRIFALHCNPKIDVGRLATRTGPITAGCHKITINLSGPGGHTGRPHLTTDLVYATGKIIGDVPVLLERRLDASSGVSLVWGRVNAGSVANAIPTNGVIEGTLRCLNDHTWRAAPEILVSLIQAIARAYDLQAEVLEQRVAPPAVNDADAAKIFELAATSAFGENVVDLAEQSMGGEDFAWYLEKVPGCLVRLGTRRIGSDDNFDIHQPNFNVDESAIAIGVRVLTMTALKSLESS